MRNKVVKILAGLVGLVALAGGGFALFISLDWPVKRPVPTLALKVQATPERLARGKVLVAVRCAGCHYDQKTGTLSGHEMADAPKDFGRIFSHNITRHPTRGAGRYSDGELAVLLRTGMRRDGVFSGPFMQAPFLADEDIDAIIAFLRSDDPSVAATDVGDRDWQPTFLAKMLMHVAFKPMELPPGKILPPDPNDAVALGRYVAQGVGDCFVCHSASFKTLDARHPEQSAGYFGGGNPTLDSDGNVVRTANLTMDRETGIGAWSEADFVATVRTGVRPGGRAMRFPMVAYRELSEAEVKGIFAYLKTVPVLHNAVDRGFDKYPAMLASAGQGEQLYNRYACASCHGKEGVGVCDLRAASAKYPSDEKLSAFLHDASQFVPGTKMPTWGGVIQEAEFPPLIAYVHSLERRTVTGAPAHGGPSSP